MRAVHFHAPPAGLASSVAVSQNAGMELPAATRGPRWAIGERFVLDRAERLLLCRAEAVAIAPRAFDFLVRLCIADGRLVTKDELLEDVWAGRFVAEGTISRHAWSLRQALGDEAGLLETVPKAGYRLHGVRRLVTPEGPDPVESGPNAGVATNAARASDRHDGVRPSGWLGRRGLLLAGLVAAPALLLAFGLRPPGAAQRRVDAAHELSLRADALTARRAEADVIEAIRLYRQALELAPDSADLRARLAVSLALVSGTVLPAATAESARQEALAALAVAPGHSEALSVLGLIAMNRDRDWRAAEDFYRQSLQGNPKLARAHHWLGEMLVLLGERPQEGLDHLAEARRLDPTSVAIASDLAKAAYFSRDYERAIEAGSAAIALDPSFAHSHRWRGLALVELGRCSQATDDLRNAVRLDPAPIVRAELANVLGCCGDLETALDLVAEIERQARSEYVSPQALVVGRIGVGDREGAFKALEGLLANDNMVLGLATAPALDSLRGDPRFEPLLARTKEPATEGKRSVSTR